VATVHAEGNDLGVNEARVTMGDRLAGIHGVSGKAGGADADSQRLAWSTAKTGGLQFHPVGLPSVRCASETTIPLGQVIHRAIGSDF
jgi:hypothetical protein